MSDFKNTHSELVGIWSADAIYDPGAQSDDILVIKPDGTGWIEEWNFCLCSVEWFEWTPTSQGWIVFASIHRMELNVKTNRFVPSQKTFATEHLPFQVTTEVISEGCSMKMLRFLMKGFMSDKFGLLSEDAASQPQPTMRT